MNTTVLSDVVFGISGYHFGDNKMNVRFSKDNGNLTAWFDGFLPPNLSICIRFYTDNIRHVNQLGIVNIFTPYNIPNKRPLFDVLCYGESYCETEYHGLLVPKPENYPKTNLIRKWSSLCIGIQFVEDNLMVFYNGKHSNQELEQKRKENGRKMDSQLPKGYFEGTEESSSSLPFYYSTF